MSLPLKAENALLRKLLVQTTRAYEEQMAELVAKEAVLHAEKERAEVTLHSIGDAVITTDAGGVIDYLNPVAESLTGWTAQEARGLPLHQVFRIINEYTREEAVNPVDVCLRDDAVVGLANHTVLIARDGREISINDSAAPIRDRKGRIIGVVLVFHDVTSAREMASKLSWQATHDALTGLANRSEFEHRLNGLLESALNEDKQHALLYIDLDQFKVVNDTCGHAAGDELLRQIPSLLEGQVRDADTVARLGGDEFGLLLEGCSLEHAVEIAGKIRQVFRDYRFPWQDKTFDIGASIGVVAIDQYSRDLNRVLGHADVACYAAKERGRNRVHVYQPDDAELNRRQGEMHWVAGVTQALQEERFLLYGQRIEPVLDGQEDAFYEILLRLKDEDGGLVPPDTFIPAAERYGLMPEVDRWVIRKAFSMLAEWHVANAGCHHACCTINLSGHSLSDETFHDFIHEQFTAFPIDPQRICFEITETAAIANLSRATQFITRLKALGCRFALDDFGSGLSSFAYLKTLPVDFLKIDGRFVRDIVQDPIDHAMVSAINQVGQVMGIQTIAEFVEDGAILDRLRGIGVNYSQGYGIERPRPFQDILFGD